MSPRRCFRLTGERRSITHLVNGYDGGKQAIANSRRIALASRRHFDRAGRAAELEQAEEFLLRQAELAAAIAPEKMMSNSSRFSCNTRSIRSSIVSSMRNRVTVTGPSTPMRWARLIA